MCGIIFILYIQSIKIRSFIAGSMAFVGMMVGALIWGNLADTVGRRTTLIVALSVNVIFGIFAAFVPYYWMFLICRFGSGVG